MVTYLIDVNQISLGNVVGHYGCPKAVVKTVNQNEHVEVNRLLKKYYEKDI